MRRHAITIVAGVLGTIWLAAIAIQLCFVADLAGIPWLIGAIVAQIAAFLISGSLLLVTNTRRPWGIDPNVRPAAADPFGQTTDELRNAVMIGDRPYGRRTSDDMAVVHRLIDRLEKDDSARLPPESTPAWALDLQSEHITVAPTPPEEL